MYIITRRSDNDSRNQKEFLEQLVEDLETDKNPRSADDVTLHLFV